MTSGVPEEVFKDCEEGTAYNFILHLLNVCIYRTVN